MPADANHSENSLEYDRGLFQSKHISIFEPLAAETGSTRMIGRDRRRQSGGPIICCSTQHAPDACTEWVEPIRSLYHFRDTSCAGYLVCGVRPVDCPSPCCACVPRFALRRRVLLALHHRKQRCAPPLCAHFRALRRSSNLASSFEALFMSWLRCCSRIVRLRLPPPPPRLLLPLPPPFSSPRRSCAS